MRRAVVALVLVLGGEARAQRIIGEEAGILGGEQGFFRPAGRGPPPTPTFDLVAGTTTPNNLSDTLTVNSTPLTLALACDAQGVAGTTWVCRGPSGSVTLNEAGTGASPTTSTLTPWRALDSAERQTTYATGAKRHDAPSSATASIATEDIVIEVVGKVSATSGAVIMDKGLAGTDGWQLSQSTTTGIQLALRTASTTTTVSGPTGQTAAWHHSIAFVDRSEASTNGAVVYSNGTAGTGANLSARAGSLANAATLALGAASAGSSNAATIASLRIWTCAGCMAGGATNPAQWAPIARLRAAEAWGLEPSIAAGSMTPTALTRATTAHVDVVDGSTRHLYLAGNHAPRVARRTYSGGTATVGYLNEVSASNLALQSQTLATTWTAITVGDNVLSDAFAGADLSNTGDNIDGANSPAEHGLRQGIAVTPAVHTFSAWARAGAQTWVALRNSTIANGTAWFDLSTCTGGSCTIGENCPTAVGTQQAGVTRASAERFPIDTTGDGTADVNLCRVSITYTGTAATHNHDLLCAPSNGLLTYADADAAADCGFWGVRVEAYPVATSYLATTTAAAARNADDVRFDAASHYTGSPTTLLASILCPSFTSTTTINVVGIGSSSTNYFGHRIFGATPDRPNFLGRDAAGIQWNGDGSSGDVTDGVLHTVRTTAATDDVVGYFDGVSVFTDTVANLPATASTSIVLGAIYPGSGSGAASCLVPRVRIFSALVSPTVIP